MRGRSQTESKRSVSWALLAVLAALIFVAFVRLRVADVPLERDEGEYAYAGRLILEGIPPYSIAYNMKFPGTYYAYATILAIFGQTAWGIRVGLLLVNAGTILLMYAVGRRLLGRFAGASAAVCFAILSLDRWVNGISAHATHFVVLTAMAGFLVLLRAIERQRASAFFWSGVLLGISVLMKQHAIFFLPLGAALVVFGDHAGDGGGRAKAKSVGLVAIGSVLPFVAIVLVLAAQGVWERFWFWTFRYASAYVSQVPLAEVLRSFSFGFGIITRATLPFWILGALGMAALWFTRWEPRARIFVTGLAVTSLLAVCPGFYFRQHYFILLLPAVALGCGIVAESLRRFSAVLSCVVILGVIGAYVTKESSYLLTMGMRELSRTMYAANPFIEAVEIGKYLRAQSDEGDRIAVLGSEPEIYFYADRKAATGYIYTYALMEPQPFAAAMQQEMIEEIETAHPRYLVFSWVRVSWLPRQESDQRIINWGRTYARQCYDQVGAVDMISPEETQFVWGDAAKDYVYRSENVIQTFRRKSDAPCAVSR